MNWISRLAMPLLSKELVELAAQRRTYIMRVTYATLLFLAGFAFYYQILLRYRSNPFAVLGKGHELYTFIVMTQFIGIYIFMPAMTSGVITAEKERNSLGLLFLTRLGPWNIVLEKYVSRVIPMLSFLLLSIPLLVIAYLIGGVTQGYLWCGVWFLFITTLQVGALGIFCSTFFRTNVAAFVASYILGMLMLFSIPILNEILRLDVTREIPSLLRNQFGIDVGRNRVDWITGMFLGPVVFELTRSASLLEKAIASCPILLLTATFLVLARVCLVRRAFLSPSNLVLRIFSRLDRFFTQLNDNRLTRGIVLIPDRSSLATLTEPVAWRETTKTALGSPRYLIRLLLLIEIPVCALGLLLFTVSGDFGPFTVLLLLLWALSTLVVSVKATSLVASERAHQTLDVMLTTPMTSREFVLEKMQGVRRLIAVLSIPLLTGVFFKSWIMFSVGHTHYRRNLPNNWGLYVFCAVLCIIVYLPLTAWLSCLVGIRVKSQARAVFTSLAVIVAWCVLPIFLTAMLIEIRDANVRQLRDPLAYLMLVSPAMMPISNEFFEPLYRTFDNVSTAVIANFLFHGGMLIGIRSICLRNLDRFLGRASGGTT